MSLEDLLLGLPQEPASGYDLKGTIVERLWTFCQIERE